MVPHCIQPDIAMPFSFVTCLSNHEVLHANLLTSPCLGPGCEHEFTSFPDCASAAAGLNAGLQSAKHEYLVFVHQDVFLPHGWDQCLANQIVEAERQFGPIDVTGVYGVGEVVAPADLSRPLAAAPSAGSLIAAVSSAMAPSCLPESRPWTSCYWSCGAIPACDSTPRWGSTFTAPTSAFRHANGAWPSSRLVPCATTTRGVSGCRRRSSLARRSSPANGATGCRSRLRVSSSTAVGVCTFLATHRLGQLRSLTPCRDTDRDGMNRGLAETLSESCRLVRSIAEDLDLKKRRFNHGSH